MWTADYNITNVNISDLVIRSDHESRRETLLFFRFAYRNESSDMIAVDNNT